MFSLLTPARLQNNPMPLAPASHTPAPWRDQEMLTLERLLFTCALWLRVFADVIGTTFLTEISCSVEHHSLLQNLHKVLNVAVRSWNPACRFS